MTALRARETFHVGNATIKRGQLVNSTDPIVKGREQFFEDPASVEVPLVEQATAAPGERRAVRKPRKS